MSNEKFTPGPWKLILDETKNELIVFVKGELGDPILTMPKATGRKTYNAELIAAAPDMYEALSRVEQYMIFDNPDIKRAVIAALNKANPNK